MSALLMLLLASVAALVQIGAVPAAFAQPLAGPVLPVVLIAGWAAVRDPREVWPAPLAAALILGSLSEARVGWYVLALLPPAALAVLARSRERRGEAAARRAVAIAAIVGAAGAACYVVLLTASAGALHTLPAETGVIAAGASWTAALAAALAAALWPLRPRGAGLFE